MVADQGPLFDFTAWRREFLQNPDASFESDLVKLRDTLRESVASVPLEQLRTWQEHCARRRATLLEVYPHLSQFFDPEPQSPEEQEYQFCDVIISLLQLEAAKRQPEVSDEAQTSNRPWEHVGRSPETVPTGGSQQANPREAFLKPYLDKKGWSVLDWANASGVDYKTASAYLKGESKSYRSTRKKLADSLGVPVEDLPL